MQPPPKTRRANHRPCKIPQKQEWFRNVLKTQRRCGQNRDLIGIFVLTHFREFRYAGGFLISQRLKALSFPPPNLSPKNLLLRELIDLSSFPFRGDPPRRRPRPRRKDSFVLAWFEKSCRKADRDQTHVSWIQHLWGIACLVFRCPPRKTATIGEYLLGAFGRPLCLTTNGLSLKQIKIPISGWSGPQFAFQVHDDDQDLVQWIES